MALPWLGPSWTKLLKENLRLEVAEVRSQAQAQPQRTRLDELVLQLQRALQLQHHGCGKGAASLSELQKFNAFWPRLDLGAL